ncbi:MAG: YdcF family protein [Sphingobacteriales bacterium]
MFFVLSKLLAIFIFPLTWVFSLLIAAVISKKQKTKHRFLILSVVLLWVFSNSFLLNQFARVWDINPVPLKTTGAYSCAIVLGGFTAEDAKGGGFFNTSADRFIQGLKLITTGKVTHILISSGNGNLVHDNFAEADWVKTQLQQFKVPDSCILIENRSRNTIENTAFSKSVLNARRLQPPYLLVTSAFHTRRALGIFKTTGVDVVPYPCNFIAGRAGFSFAALLPDAESFYKWNIYIREVVGSGVNWFR